MIPTLPLSGQAAAAGASARRARFDKALAAIGAAGAPVGAASGYFVPGRIEVLGKHTDYGGGRTLVAAVDRGFVVAAAPGKGRSVRVVNADSGDGVTCEIDADLSPPAGDWANYPLTVIRRLARNFPSFERGATLAFTSDLPPAAGLSSSSALLIAVYLGLADVNDLERSAPFREWIGTREDLAAYLATVENGQSFRGLTGDAGVGTFGGSEDHTAILCCRTGHLAQYRFGPVRLERHVGLDDSLVFVVAASGVEARKTGAARDQYNRASRLAARVLSLWRAHGGGHVDSLAGLADAGPAVRSAVRDLLGGSADAEFSAQELLTRFDQFALEHGELVPAAADALERGDLPAFGRAVRRSQEAAERWLGNQVPETRELPALALECGAVAASAFGAGFGGSVWALVPHANEETFTEAWRSSYGHRFPDRLPDARFLATRPGPAAYRVDLNA